MKNDYLIRIHLAPLFVTTFLALFPLARPGVAQSNKPADNLDALAASGNAEAGGQIFRGVGCTDCHGEDAQGSDGPGLINIKITFQQFVHWVRNASNGMFPFTPDAVSDAQLADIYAFIERNPKPAASPATTKAEQPADASAPAGNAASGGETSSKPAGSKPAAKPESHADTATPPGDPASGAQAFSRVGCSECHGEKAEGSEGPALVNLPKTFQEFVKFVRSPSSPMPNEFPPEIVSDGQLADIYAFIEHPPDSAGAAK